MQGAIPRGTAFQTLFPDFKISMGFKADSGMLTGICEIYKQRTDVEQEYAIREIGVVLVPKGSEPTNDMVNQAIKTAREAAINTLEQFLSVVSAAGLNETASAISPKRGNNEKQGAPVQAESVSPVVLERTEADETPPAEPEDSVVQGSVDDAPPPVSVPDFPTEKDITASSADSVINGVGAAITKVPFSAELFPASSLVKQTAPGVVRFSIREGELEEFRVECIDWLETKEDCINEFNANGYMVYAVFSEEEMEQLKQDLNLDLASKVM